MDDTPLKEIKWEEVQPGPESPDKKQSMPSNLTKERKLRQAVSDGRYWTTRQILEASKPLVNINCTDSFGRTPLVLATDKRRVNIRIIQILIKYGANTETALLHAVSQNNIESLKILLRYRPEGSSDSSNNNENINISYVTPLMLAAKIGNYEMVKVLISHGEKVMEHPLTCKCCSCSSFETNIGRAIIRLESYKALSNPMYISALYIVNSDTAEDPLFTAMVLKKKLRRLAIAEYEFKEEYLGLCKALDDFSVSLLNECQHIQEVQSVMNMRDTDACKEDSTMPDEAKNLTILNFAIKNQNKKFIAHSFSQLMINHEVYRMFPQWKNISLHLKYVIMLVVMVLFPIWTCSYLFFPNSQLTRLLRTPLAKFMVFMGSYHVFVALLIASSFQSDHDFLKVNFTDWLVIFYLIGYCLDIAKEIYRTGRKQYFSNWYNYIFVTMVAAFILHYFIWLIGYVSLTVKTDYWSVAIRNLVKLEGTAAYEMVLVSFSFYTLGVLLSFIYLLSMFHLHPTLGPLLMTLLKMMQDVANFFLFFLFLFIAFVVCLKKLYLQYKQSGTRFFPDFASNSTNAHYNKMAGLKGSVEVVFWSLFGQVQLNEFETEDNYKIIKITALVVFGIFNLLAVLVALNMLIAMLNESFVLYASEKDVGWKYSRTKMMLALMHKSSVLPPPLNLIPTPRAIAQLFQFVTRICCRKECCKAEYFQVKRSQQATTDNRKRQDVIRRLVIRHLWSTEMKNRSANSTVAELDRARQDLARLIMPLSAATQELQEKQNQDQPIKDTDDVDGTQRKP